tara:strand:+ start:3683 stop:4069 length:387 start_codon:yes stop_codon:yes gene_type:complete
MASFLEGSNSVLLVSLGAVIGAYLRVEFLKYSELIFKRKYSGVIVINLIATFFLGFTISFFDYLELNNSDKPLWLFLCVGFLGSFSTFSTFIGNLFSSLIERNFRDFSIILIISLFGGLFFAYLGFIL